jgi:DNA-binding NarL/FixJ family response regulator
MMSHVQTMAPASACAVVADAAPARPRVLIVDDHALLRFGLRTMLLADRADIEFEEAACLQDAIDCFGLRPGIELVLLDLNMGDCRGLQGLRRFREIFPQSRVAVLSATHDEFVVRQAQSLGAVAYIAKSSEPAKMSQMILSLLRPGTDRAAGISVGGFAPLGRKDSYDRVSELGARHLEILDLVLFGCSNQEISNATHLSLGTVKNYVSTILLALDVKSRSHLISLFR